jgi:hypothetical protein
MATIVLVHGIAQEQGSTDSLEEAWLPHLAGGVRLAGFEELADRLWRRRESADGIETRMAFYGDCFLRPGRMGADPGQLTSEQEALAERLAEAWLRRVAVDASDPPNRQAAALELAALHNTLGQEQGFGKAKRTAIVGLSRVPWFAPLGMALAQRFIWRALAQVTRYFTDEGVRAYALERVEQLIDPGTKVLIGHSLGSVVAYEVCHRLARPLPLLITLGSPLGLRSIIYDRLRPQPPAFPPHVVRWTNLAGRDDFIAAAPDLTGLFAAQPPAAVFEGGWLLDTGAKPHDPGFYLTKRETGRPIGETLDGTG